MSSLHEIVKPLLDAGVGPYTYDGEWAEDGFDTFGQHREDRVRLAFIGWLVEELKEGARCADATGTWLEYDYNDPDLLACLVKAWEVRREQ